MALAPGLEATGADVGQGLATPRLRDGRQVSVFQCRRPCRDARGALPGQELWLSQGVRLHWRCCRAKGGSLGAREEKVSDFENSVIMVVAAVCEGDLGEMDEVLLGRLARGTAVLLWPRRVEGAVLV